MNSTQHNVKAKWRDRYIADSKILRHVLVACGNRMFYIKSIELSILFSSFTVRLRKCRNQKQLILLYHNPFDDVINMPITTLLVICSSFMLLVNRAVNT